MYGYKDNTQQNDKIYVLADTVSNQSCAVPEGKRIPFGWSAAAVGASSKEWVRLFWSVPVSDQPGYLRISVALDLREEVCVEVVTAVTSVQIGMLDIRYASVFQPYQLQLTAAQMALISSEGVELRLVKGRAPLWIFTEGPVEAPLLLPHLLRTPCESFNPWSRLSNTLASMSSLQPFGWLEGCVLDGLLDLEGAVGGGHFRETARKHIQMFFDKQGILRYENPRSEPVDGQVYGIEGTLPFAALAQLEPQHPALEKAIAFWLSERAEDGSIWDGAMLSAEGCYTIAYPMAVLAKIYRRVDLVDSALQQLEIRKNKLVCENALYLRYLSDGSRSFCHWTRAYAWYMLGFARTLRVLQEIIGLPEAILRRIDLLKRELARVAEEVMKYQSQEGLWFVYVNEPYTGVETSGSSAIATALAIGVQLGILDRNILSICDSARGSLAKYVTSDGILHGVTQNNKAGEELQRNGYRILSQMGTGLAAQLEAAMKLVKPYEVS
ncbi:hypothetical protein PAECIP111891_04619 [Paenibacillus allorhizoplanae]|uniref:Glycosyl hydrolase n=1 Tax=Paenibacillus allorhizoplanae TaxID=2905648 RepID=A0ABM9CNW0_9BACL|nr:glycoside hydrolase family 88 protein [Paenibacillus allorhizoplanae]CAH1217681.1 hypothetical protein PAECIP111891_04619 [Paenibacillus allorhizoplanae]